MIKLYRRFSYNRNEYPEFEALKADYLEREKLLLSELHELDRQRNEILNSSVLYRLCKWIEIAQYYIAIFSGLVVYLTFNLLCSKISFAILLSLLKRLVNSKAKIAERVLLASGSIWKMLDESFKLANDKLQIIRNEYN